MGTFSVFFIVRMLCLISNNVGQISNPLTGWTEPLSPQLPNSQATLMSGYHEKTNRIWLIGGSDTIYTANERWYYDIDTNEFTDNGSLPFSIDNLNSQSYTQLNNSIYFTNNNLLREFNMNTGLITTFSVTLYHTNINAPCLANDGRYIFVIGGEDENDLYTDGTNKFTIYDLYNNQWIVGKALQRRKRFACNTSPDGNWLYVFGGSYVDAFGSDHIRNSIQKVFIADMTNITSKSWKSAGTMSSNPYFSRSVVDKVNNLFYIIGGRKTFGGDADNRILIINPLDDTKMSSVIMNTARSSPAAIIANQIVYVFGGTDIVEFTSFEMSNILTLEPTPNPTISPIPPTNLPTNNPSNQPTIYPTYVPSMPSLIPTNIPTLPTTFPTNIPTTKIPTDSPTNRPTTSIPTYRLPVTNTPTALPAAEIIETTQSNTGFLTGTGGGNFEINDDSSDNPPFQIITLVIGIIFVIILILSLIDSRYFRVNDFYRFGALITGLIQIMDMICDILFSAQIIPVLLSLFQLHRELNTNWIKNDLLRGWITDNIKLLYFLSIISGSSFAGIQICYSNMFNLSQFDIPLTKTQLISFQTKRVYSTVLLENVPQLGLQIWYISYSSSSFETTASIAIISMIFSLISIIIAFISMLTQKRLLDSQNYVTIEFEIRGNMVSSNSHKYKNQIKTIQQQLGSLLGVESSLIEIIRPEIIPDGIKVHLNIFVNLSTAIDMNYQKLIINSKNNGKIGKIIRHAWSLDVEPLIDNIKYAENISAQRIRTTVNIKSKSIQQNIEENIVTIEMNSTNASGENIDIIAPHVVQPKQTAGFIKDDNEGDSTDSSKSNNNYNYNNNINTGGNLTDNDDDIDDIDNGNYDDGLTIGNIEEDQMAIEIDNALLTKGNDK